MRIFVILVVIWIGNLNAQPNHELFDSVLKTYVSIDGEVSYEQLSAHHKDLTPYLNELVNHQPKDSWSREERLSYWINAYNAYTLKLIIDHYPVESIKDIETPWDKKFIPFEGSLISLNTIEHDILRPMNEPRIHFAIVCSAFRSLPT